MRTITVVALALALASPASAASRQQTGNEWAAECISGNAAKIAHCLGYARGLADAFGAWSAFSEHTAIVCIPDRVVAFQLRDVALKWMTSNPSRRHEEAGYVLMIAFAEAWPCSKKELTP